ncbi:MAG: ABC transporter permease [Actinomycetaceae bacterium]|nr:ABC transporter permease [Actinomycetaceae bacterium]
MTNFIIRKLLLLVPMSLGVSMIIFFAIRLSPVDPINIMATPDQNLSPEKLEELRQSLGLNDPLILQYLRWLKDVLTGNWGNSIQTGQPVTEIIAARFPATLEIMGWALILSTIIGISWGLLSAAFQNSIIDHLGRFMTVMGIAVPGFFLGIIVIQVFAYKLEWFNPGGRIYPGEYTFFDRAPNLVLPVLTLTFGLIGVLIRYTRNSALDVMAKDYIKTARSKGISERQVYLRHVLRNSLGPVLVILVFRLPSLVGGSVLVETIFKWPGIGSTIVTSISSSDYPVIMITSMMVALAILVASFLVDVVKAIVDPRIRLS